jgi:quercetin dioxygenase-like cupin family protein
VLLEDDRHLTRLVVEADTLLSRADAGVSDSSFPGPRTPRRRSSTSNPLPGIPGKSIKGVLVEYGPGGYSPSHTHAKSAIIYATVIEGEVRSKVNDGPEKTYRTGENWTESWRE